MESALAAAVMAIPARNSSPFAVVSPERTFFVTSSIFEKRRLLQSDRSAQLFLQVLYDYRDQKKFRLHDFVVMPDHFHLLITVGADSSIERAVQFIKGGFAYRAGKELGFLAPVRQKGFSEVRVLDESTCTTIREYIRQNPVRRNLASTPEEYRFSSAFGGFELDALPQRLKPFLSCFPGGAPEGAP